MPTKFPCIKCSKPVKSNQKAIFCEICKLWVHFKCTSLSKAHYDFLATNVGIPFNCQKCRPLLFVADEILNAPLSNVNNSTCNDDSSTAIDLHQQSSAQITVSHSSISRVDSEPVSDKSDDEFSDAHSSDFTFESDEESDSELRGLNFNSLSTQNKASSSSRTRRPCNVNFQTIKYKYQCNICMGCCKENVQDSIQCTWCDE